MRTNGSSDERASGETSEIENLVRVGHQVVSRIDRRQQDEDRVNIRLLIARHLGAGTDEVVYTNQRFDAISDPGIRLCLAADLRTHPSVQVLGADPSFAPSWGQIDIGDQHLRVPDLVTILFPQESIIESPMVIRTFSQHGQRIVEAATRGQDAEAGAAYLQALQSRARGAESPYRNKTLRAVASPMLQFEIIPPLVEQRSRLVLPPQSWEIVDLNVFRMFEEMDYLESVGLGTNRGLLLAGPPGTGKTALCRVLATELAGAITVVLCDATVGHYLISHLYSEIAHLSPALVLLEDLDLLIGDREAGDEGNALIEFLTVLDGLMTAHGRVVTVATTNDPGSIDRAATRAARFDQVVTFNLPDMLARRTILERYCSAVSKDLNLDAIAKSTEGATGADLRELVRAAVLNRKSVDTALLLELAGERTEAAR